MSSDRDFDLVVFGATGFTGRLVSQYLARTAGADLRWALAGRSLSRLGAVARDLHRAYGDRAAPALIEADVSRPESLAAMAKRTRVLLTTVGPFARFGEPVVSACVANATDYVDITGEPMFVDRICERYGSQAEDVGIRVVSCCGFDSVPHDLGAWFTVQHLPRDQPIELRAFVSSKGSFSGGTWQSAVQAMGALQEFREQRRTFGRQPATDGRRVGSLPQKIHYEEALDAWAVPLPTIDPQIVLRSARALSEYGPDFRYGHYAKMRSLRTVAAAAAGVASIVALAQLEVTRELLLKVRSSGEGPSRAQRERGWFIVRFHGKAADGTEVVTQVVGGDPGYDETSKMVAESALCLAFDRPREEGPCGVLTPTVAMGNALIQRLQRAGIAFELVRGG